MCYNVKLLSKLHVVSYICSQASGVQNVTTFIAVHVKNKGKKASFFFLSCSHLIFTVVLPVLRVPYPDDDVSGAEMKIWVICNIVHADILLHTNHLDEK